MGQSVNVKARWSDYRGLFCSHQRSLIASFKKYGVDDHVFGILYRCPREKLNEAEEYFVNTFNACDNRYGMNLKLGGGSRAGVSEETREKIRKGSIGKNKGRKMSPEAIERMRQTKLAQHTRVSDEMKKQISNKLRGRKLTEEHKANLKKAMAAVYERKGKTKRGPMSDEVKRKISEANKGRKSPMRGRVFTEEHRKNLSRALKKRVITKEWRENMSKAKRGKPWSEERRKAEQSKRKKS